MTIKVVCKRCNTPLQVTGGDEGNGKPTIVNVEPCKICIVYGEEYERFLNRVQEQIRDDVALGVAIVDEALRPKSFWERYRTRIMLIGVTIPVLGYLIGRLIR